MAKEILRHTPPGFSKYRRETLYAALSLLLPPGWGEITSGGQPWRVIVGWCLWLIPLCLALDVFRRWTRDADRLHFVKYPIMILVIAAFFITAGYSIWYVTRPSFVFVKPGALANPNQPGAFWIFIVVNRGRETLYNVSVHFQDMDKSEAVKRRLEAGVPPLEAGVEGDVVSLHYPELDANTTGGSDNEGASFYWTPGTLDDEHFDILVIHRQGTSRERLQIKRINDKWQVAMRVTDEKTHRNFVSCRDRNFPVDSEWPVELPQCFPAYAH